LFLEATAAQHRSALGWFEGDCRLCSALRTRGPGFGTNLLISANALGLALFASLRVVLELFVVEENLLASSKNKLGAAVNARQYSIGEFHDRLPRNRDIHRSRLKFSACHSRFPVFVRDKH
jgi:hypothetical protein